MRLKNPSEELTPSTMGRAIVATILFACLAFASQSALALTLNIVDAETGSPVAPFRWLVNEDNTNQTDPRNPDLTGSLSVTIARSHSPVIASGTSFNARLLQFLPPGGRYVVSVFAPGYKMNTGYMDAGQTSVTVRLLPYPLPLAQITVLAFHDNHPINSAPDVPAEEYLEGFRVALYDQAGEMGVDYWGNALGTTPVIGDWNGDGKDEIGVFRNDGTWSLDINGDGLWSGVDAYFTYGDGTDIPLTGNR